MDLQEVGCVYMDWIELVRVIKWKMGWAGHVARMGK